MTPPQRIPQEMEQIIEDYYRLFGEGCPLSFVGFARIYEAIKTKTPVPYSEYEKMENDEEEAPNHCGAWTSEEQQAIIEYERMFGEDCPYGHVECERIKEAIAAKTPIPQSEYADAMRIM